MKSIIYFFKNILNIFKSETYNDTVESEIRLYDIVQMKTEYESKYYYTSQKFKVVFIDKDIITLKSIDTSEIKKYHKMIFNVI